MGRMVRQEQDPLLVACGVKLLQPLDPDFVPKAKEKPATLRDAIPKKSGHGSFLHLIWIFLHLFLLGIDIFKYLKINSLAINW